jgi:integrase
MVDNARAGLRRRLCDDLSTLLAIGGGDTAPIVATMLGHSRPDMTAHYTDNLAPKAADAAARLG